MAHKKRVSGKKNSKGRVTRVIHQSTKELRVDRALTDNFIALQKVMVNLSVKFDNLSSQISKLLELFEISAKNLARRDYSGFQQSEVMQHSSMDSNRKIIEKLDILAEQAGLIGKGLALIHEVNSEKHGLQAAPMQIPMKPQAKFVSPLPNPSTKPSLQTQMAKKPGLEEISSELSELEEPGRSKSPFSKENP